MTTNVLPDLDRSTVDDLRKKLPDLTELELPKLPSMQQVGKTADQTIDRLLGRSRPSVWPWVAVGIAVVAVVGAIAAYLTWYRRPSPTELGTTWIEPNSPEVGPADAFGEAASTESPSSSAMTGLTAAEASLSTSPYPPEES